MGCPRIELIQVLKQQVLPTLEQAVPFWGPLVTQKEKNQIERVLKIGLKIVMGDEFHSYPHALSSANMLSLDQRRQKLIQNFAQKAAINPKFNSWFNPSPQRVINTRADIPTYCPPNTRTVRMDHTAIPPNDSILKFPPP